MRVIAVKKRREVLFRLPFDGGGRVGAKKIDRFSRLSYSPLDPAGFQSEHPVRLPYDPEN